MSEDAETSPSENVLRARTFLLCDEAKRWQGGGPYCLTRVRHRITTLPGNTYPRYFPGMWAYAQLSGGIGRHSLQVQQVCLHDQTSIYRWQPVILEMGSDPTNVAEIALPLGQVLFWRPGQYEFILFTGNRQLAVAVVEAREEQ